MASPMALNGSTAMAVHAHLSSILAGARVHSVWIAPRGALAASGIPYALRDGRFEWVASALEKGYARAASYESPVELNVTALDRIGRNADRTLLLKVEPRSYGAATVSASTTSGGSPARTNLFVYYSSPGRDAV